MNRTVLWLGVIVPIVLSIVYGITLPNVPADAQAWFNGEDGPVEIVGALLFVAAAVLAAKLAVKLRRPPEPVPWTCPAWFWFMAIGAAFMFFEEISWGQHLFEWESPEFFVEHNKQAETNLHNLGGDLPSRALRRVAEIGMPVFALVLPLIFRFGRDSWERGHWPRYFIPKFELALWATISILIRPVRKGIELRWPEQYRSSLSEYQELVWAAALVLYLIVMWQRLLGSARPSVPPVEAPREAGAT